MITLRQLRYLQALARHRHFGRAAEACAVTQPALSMQIRELEKELGVELVDRRPGDAALTEIGVLVAKRGHEVLAAARDLVDFARHRGRLLKGQLKLGVIPTLAPYVLPKLLPLLHVRHPEQVVQIRETQTKILRFSPDVAVEKWPLRGSPATTRRRHLPMFPRQSVCSSPMDIGVRHYAGGAGHVRWSERALPGTAEWQLRLRGPHCSERLLRDGA